MLPMLATFGLGAVLGDGSAVVVAVFLVLLLPGALLSWVALASHGILLPLAGMMVMILTPWTAVLLPEIAPLGHVAVRDAAPRPEFQRDVDVSRTIARSPMRGGAPQPRLERGRYTVVPLVPPGWDPAQPVRAVGMREGGGTDAPPWPAQGGLVPLRDSVLRREGARQALAMAGLQPAETIAIGRWSETPWRTRLDETAPVLLAHAGAIAIWAAMVLIAGMRRR